MIAAFTMWSVLCMVQDDPKQKEKEKEKDIVITASRLDESKKDVASDITVIPSGDLKKAQHRMVENALRETPALDVVRNGPFGGRTSVFMRGAGSDQTLVLIDGVEANDAISTGRGFNFGDLTTDNIDRIEVLRGPASVLYGSDAMGGVINIITRRGEGDPRAHFLVEGGSFGTYRGSASVAGGSKLVNYSLGASYATSNGISSADSDLGSRERDGYLNKTYSGMIGLTPEPWLDLDLMVRGTSSRAEIDNGGGSPSNDDGNHIFTTDQWLLRVAPKVRLFDDFWEQTLAFSLTTLDSHDDNPPDADHPGDFIFSVFRSQMVALDWQHTLRLDDANTLIAGAAFREESGETSTDSMSSLFGPFNDELRHLSAWIRSGYAQHRIQILQRLILSAGARIDHHREFGSHATYRGTAAYHLEETDTKLRGTIGTGFKSPSLFQLFSSFGDPTLKPEESTGWDVGVDQQFLGRRASASVTYFHNDFKNLIDFNSATFRYSNVGRAETHGVEVEARVKPISPLEVRLTYTFTDTEDKSTGDDLPRRARHRAALRADYAVTDKLGVNASLIYTGRRKDLDFSTFPATTVTLPDYSLINLAASYRIAERLEVFVRVDNVLNRDYQEVIGFGAPGTAAYGGATLEF
jgi:vitamin B12 transporter